MNNLLFQMKTVDVVFFAIFGVLLVLIIIFFIFNKIETKRTEKALKTEFARLQTEKALDEEIAKENEEEKVEETVVEEEPVIEETVVEKPAEEEPVKEVEEEPTVEEKVEEEPTVEEPVVEEHAEEEPVKEVEQPQAEEEAEQPKVVAYKGRVYQGKYEVFEENNYYRYRLKASNGEVLFVSEMYASHDTALKSIDAIKRNLEKGKTSIIVDKKKNYKFKLVAANHRALAISANYGSEKSAQSALESFKRFALTDDIVDIELPQEQLDSSLVLVAKKKEEDKKGGKFVLRKDANGEFSWEFKANNGEILCQKNGYSNKNSLDTAIVAFKDTVRNGDFYISKDKNNLYQYKLYNKGRLFVVGESYQTDDAVESVVTSILNFLELATISDRTQPKDTKAKTATKSKAKAK